MEYATASVTKQTQTQPHTMTGGPPDSTPMMRTPDSAVHEVTILKEKPTIPKSPKLRFNSTLVSMFQRRTWEILTLGVSQLREHIVVIAGSMKHLLFFRRV